MSHIKWAMRLTPLLRGVGGVLSLCNFAEHTPKSQEGSRKLTHTKWDIQLRSTFYALYGDNKLMRSLFKNVANELVQQMRPEDLKEIMDNTVDTILAKMTPHQRLEFSKAIVNNAVDKILASLTPQQRLELLQALLPSLLTHVGIDMNNIDAEQLSKILGKK